MQTWIIKNCGKGLVGFFSFLFFVGCTCSRQQNPSGAMDSGSEKVVNLFIWSDYTSPEVLQEFAQKTGILVQESNFSSNEELLAKLQAGASGYDVVIPSDYMVAAMTKLSLLQKIDKSKIPNVANLHPKLLAREYDPQNDYSLPYSWAVTGLAYNKTKTSKPLKGWKDLMQAKELQGRFSLLDDAREAAAAALKINNASLNSTRDEDLQRAKATLLQMKKNLKAFTSTPMQGLLAGELFAAHMYSNEAYLARQKSSGAIEFIFPEEGGNLYIDNFAIPQGAKHVDAAHKLIDFLLEPRVHASFINRLFAGPVLTVEKMKGQLSEEIEKNPLLSNFDDVAAKAEMMRDLGDDMVKFDKLWTEVKAAR